MTDRRPATRTRPATNPQTDADADAPLGTTLRQRHAPSSTMADRIFRPQSREEAEERYAASRDAWTAAMKASSSGRATDLAELALAQEAYETALAERERWASSPHVAIPITADRPTGIDVVVGQELSWRRVHEHEQAREQAARERKGVFSRLFRR